MTTYGDMAPKKRAFNKAFAPSKQPHTDSPSSSKAGATAPDSTSASASAAASASLYDFDFDDVDASASIAARKTLLQPSSLTGVKKASASSMLKTKSLSSKHHRSISDVASSQDGASKPSDSPPSVTQPAKPVRKTRPRSSVLTSRPAPQTNSAAEATVATTAIPLATFPPPQRSPTRTCSGQRKVASLSRSQTTPATATNRPTKPPTLHRAAVSDLYDLPMEDAPPCRKITTRRLSSTQHAPAVTPEKPSRSLKATPKSASKPAYQAVGSSNGNGRIDSYFSKASNAPANQQRENISASSATSSHSLGQKSLQGTSQISTDTSTSESPTKKTPIRNRSVYSSQNKSPPRADAKTTPKSYKMAEMSPQNRSVTPAHEASAQANPPMKRRRLIDTLAAQMESSSESESESFNSEFRSGDSKAKSQSPIHSSTNRVDQPQNRTTFQAGPRIRTRGPKVTYAMQRSIRADPNENDPNHDPFAVPILPSISSPKKDKDSFDFGDGLESDDEGGLAKGAIRSVHELRMAGANNRFADQIDDLFDRIGTPSPKPTSMRRNALLELASHIKTKTFSRQFRDNGAEGRLFADIGQETDTVSGFALVAILLTLLSSYSIPHVLPLLQENKVVHFLEGLLQSTESIIELSHQRRTNLSRNGKAAVASVKSDLIRLPIWRGSTLPKDLSPRTLALKFMDLHCKPADLGNFVISSKSMGDTLFSILHQYSDHEWQDDASADEKLDCLLASSVLGAHAMGFQDSSLKSHWNNNHLPVVVAVTDMALSHSKFGPFEHAILRLTLNLSNNNPGAATVTGLLALFKNLAATVCTTFGLVKDNLGKHDLNSDFSPFTKLVLVLGAMINFCEHCPPVRHSVDEWDEEDSPVDGLIGIFLQSHMATYQADSVEKMQLNVGFGYLAILLGYLCLSRPVRRKLEVRSAGKGLGDLRDTVREFMIMQCKVDNGEGGGSDHVQRLQKLLDELEMGI
ncbi:hypothetical protein Cpir12675_006819 [Ceratocystis pirilliformis]|uniref:Wings apart-like protein C-terminal domain-containing protein n=1 Tax=Ceratocystis pirilliformis TaxID=259994 RepID=A0ABR3YFE4_9PEZI